MSHTPEKTEKPTPVCRKKCARGLAILFLALTLAATLLPQTLLPPLGDILVRLFASAAVLFLLLGEGALRLRLRFSPRTPVTLAACVLIFLVALNNFPFEQLLSGRAQVSITPLSLAAYLLLSLVTASFEELLFRGLLLPLFLERAKPTRASLLRAVLFSSAVFAALHLFNLFSAPLPETLLQVLYTFGIGLLASLLYLLSDSLVLPFLFHALYNFGGLFLTSFGAQNLPTLGTVLFTAALATATGICALFAFFACVREKKGLPTAENTKTDI